MIQNLQFDLRQAQLDRDEIKVSTLRMLLSEINNNKIAKGQDLSDQEIISVVQREAKKRRESIEAFRIGGREEQALREEDELKILQAYLPAQISDEELIKLVEQAISESSEKPSLQDMGKIIRLVMDKVAGQADGAKISSLVKEKLSS